MNDADGEQKEFLEWWRSLPDELRDDSSSYSLSILWKEEQAMRQIIPLTNRVKQIMHSSLMSTKEEEKACSTLDEILAIVNRKIAEAYGMVPATRADELTSYSLSECRWDSPWKSVDTREVTCLYAIDGRLLGTIRHSIGREQWRMTHTTKDRTVRTYSGFLSFQDASYEMMKLLSEEGLLRIDKQPGV